MITMNVNLKLTSITRTEVKPSTGKEIKGERVSYYQGEPQFDEYESRMKALASKELTLPKNFLGPGSLCSFGDASNTLSKQICSVFERYYRGDAGSSEIEKVLSRAVSDLRSTYAELGFAPDEFTSQLIEDVYNAARLYNVRGTGEASWYEGRSIAQTHNGHGHNTRDWFYYDANLYYASEEMKGTIQGIVHRIGAKYGVSGLDLPTDYPDGDVRKGIYSSYNTVLNDRMRNDCRIGNILDETMAPPKGLKIFYMDKQGSDPFVAQLPGDKNDPYAAFDSFLSVSYGNWSYTGRVPVRMDATRFPISVNMFDVIHQGSDGGIPQGIVGFLKNMDFFSMVQSGRYMSTHPRSY